VIELHVRRAYRSPAAIELIHEPSIEVAVLVGDRTIARTWSKSVDFTK
jgi:hypothetical protein